MIISILKARHRLRSASHVPDNEYALRLKCNILAETMPLCQTSERCSSENPKPAQQISKKSSHKVYGLNNSVRGNFRSNVFVLCPKFTSLHRY